MDWCKSPIPDAIQKAKAQGSMFLVYIYGTDEQSDQMNKVWDSQEVCNWVRDTRSVPVRILSSSEECKFFSQIYPVVCVPSTYCIGGGGIPLEVIGGHLSVDEFINKLGTAQKTHESQKAEKSTPTASSSSPENQSTASSGTSESPSPEMPSSSQAGASGDTFSSLSQSEKLERAKELISKKQEEKAQKEFEKKRQEEIDRRKLGKDLHKLKQNQQEMQMKEIKEQMRKDKEEEKKAREKIRAQIARDREERASKYQRDREEKDMAAQNAKKAKLVEEQKQAAVAEAKRSETARIQVRLPDGSSFTETFPSSETLQSLLNVASQRMGCDVTLSTTFPKRVFSEEDMNSSFVDLQLAPSAVVLALPRSGRSTTVSGQSGGGNILRVLLHPLILLWGFIYSLLFGGGGGGQAGSQPSQQQSSPSDSQGTSGTRPDRPGTAYQRRPQTSRNMRRITDLRDDDDDMTTYNGNSTQQL